MPSIANLSLQNNAATAVTFTAITPSAGEGVPALWRLENSNPPGMRPTITMAAKANREKTVRTVEMRFVRPRVYTDANTSLVMSDSKAFATFSFVVPQNIDSSVIDDFVAYIRTTFADTGVIACLKAQVAPT